MNTKEPKVSFGAQDVSADEKARLVGRVFTSVADRYDLMNDVMSGGVHRLWKRALIEWLAPRPGQHLIDVAGGTGDIAFRFLDRAATAMAADSLAPGQTHATICDINQAMLGAGRNRAAQRQDMEQLSFVCGNAEQLPFPDESFDAYTIAFGIRNVTHIDRALSEARRVLKPLGRLIVMEFSRVDVPILAEVYAMWSKHGIPALGERITGDRAAYEYLVESIARFPPQEAFAAMIKKAGFARVTIRNLSGGIVAMHSAWTI